MNPSALIIEDHEPLLAAIVEYLTLGGWRADGATTKAEAMALLDTDRPYTVIIADVNLGGVHEMEGLDVVATARARYPDACVIVVTAFGTPAVESRAHDLGVAALLRKPARLAQIARLVEAKTGHAA